jgi:hypothetical protein
VPGPVCSFSFRNSKDRFGGLRMIFSASATRLSDVLPRQNLRAIENKSFSFLFLPINNAESNIYRRQIL